MLQPATLHSLPIALLMLGLAAPRPATSPEMSRTWKTSMLAIGLAGAALIAIPNLLTIHYIRSGDLATAARSASWMGDDIVVINDIADKYTNLAIQHPDDMALHDLAVSWSSRPLDIDDGQPYYWALHAKRLLSLGEYDSVPAAIDRALALERWNPSAWETRLTYAAAIKDYELADETREVVCRLDLTLCVTGSRSPVSLEAP